MAHVTADQIKRALSKRHKDDAFFVEVKTGSTWEGGIRIIDALAIKKSWAHPLIVGYEIKVNRQDLIRDQKWVEYLNFCHQFYFVCPANLIDTAEVPPNIGLMYYNPDKESLWPQRKAEYRTIEMPTNLFYYIIISRLESDRHPFFSSEREQLEAWVADRHDRIKLGWEVRQKLRDKERKLDETRRALEEEVEQYKVYKQEIDEIHEAMKAAGLDIGWGWQNIIKKMLSGDYLIAARRSLTELDVSLRRVKRALGIELD